jgi:hypothetical protein
MSSHDLPPIVFGAIVGILAHTLWLGAEAPANAGRGVVSHECVCHVKCELDYTSTGTPEVGGLFSWLGCWRAAFGGFLAGALCGAAFVVLLWGVSWCRSRGRGAVGGAKGALAVKGKGVGVRGGALCLE